MTTIYTEDKAHVTGDEGPVLLAVRKDTAAALAGTDGDYAPLEVDASGKLHVNPGTVTIADGSGAITVDSTQLPAALAANGGLKVEGVAGGVAQPISAASGTIASGAVASGAVASGAIASGAVASGAIASGAVASGAVVDGALVTLGAKADAKSTATDTTAVTAMQVLKEISYMEQNPAARAVTATQLPTGLAAGGGLKVEGVVGGTAVRSMPYLYDIAEGNIVDHASWSKIGFNGSVGTSEEDIWTAGAKYVWPAAEMQMQVVSGSAKDMTKAITAFADGTGKVTVTCTAHGLADGDKITISGTTSYNGNWVVADKTDNNFTIAATWVADDATGSLAGPGARTVIIYYLDDAFAEKTETVTLNGTTAVNTTATDIFRVQGFRVATAGDTGYAVGAITLKDTSATVTYSQIVAGYTRARNITYTVPAGKVLYITSATFSVHSATKGVRFTTRATYDQTAAAIRTFFLPYTEICMTNGAVVREFEMPTRLPAGVRLLVSGVADADGAVASVALRGWLESA